MNVHEWGGPSFLLDLIQSLVIVLLWLRKPGQDANQRLVEANQRVDKIEEHLKHVPKTTELVELKGEIRATNATVHGMSDRLNGVSSAVYRIENFLLQQQKDK